MSDADSAATHEPICLVCGATVEGLYCASCATPIGFPGVGTADVAPIREEAGPQMTPEPASSGWATGRSAALPALAPPSAEEQDILLAASLAEHLRSGGSPTTQPLNVRLIDGEVGFGSLEADLFTYSGADHVEPSSVFAVFGSPPWIVDPSPAQGGMNTRQRRRAERIAAEQWRLEDRGVLYVTNRRVALQGLYGWVDLYYEHFRFIAPSSMGIVAHFSNWPVLRITTSSPAWMWVMMSTYVLGQVPVISVRDDHRTPAPGAAAAQPARSDEVN